MIRTANGRIPVMPGVHGDSLEETLELARYASECGADAVTVVIPRFVEPSSEAVYRYYETVAISVELPLVLYEPRNMGERSITPDLLARLAQIDNIVTAVGRFANRPYGPPLNVNP